MSQDRAITVRAAGVVVMRHSEHGAQFLAVHRPSRKDWSLPKGKMDQGEHIVATAIRECEEETGLRVALACPLPSQTYLAMGRPKIVNYWNARMVSDAGFVPDDEVDEITWVSVHEAGSVLTYEHDVALVVSASAIPVTSPLILLRHAKAMKRADYSGSIDALRPLSGKGRSQAKALIPILDAFGIANVHSSPSTRCVDTVRRFARANDLPLHEEPALSEEGHAANPDRAAERMRALVSKPGPVVVCSHRPVMPTLIAALAAETGLSVSLPELDARLSPAEMIVVHRSFDARGVRTVAIERHGLGSDAD